MDHCPITVNPPGQQGSILVLWRHNHAESLEASEIFGKCERNTWAAAGKGRVRHCVLLKFRHVSDAWIFDTPNLFRILPRICNEGRLGVDSPSIDTTGRSRGAEMRYASAILDATQEQRVSIRKSHSPRVEDAVDGIRPMLAAEDRILTATNEERHFIMPLLCRRLRSFAILKCGRSSSGIQWETLISWYVSFALGSVDACISSSAIRKESVDSAPWFS